MAFVAGLLSGVVSFGAVRSVYRHVVPLPQARPLAASPVTAIMNPADPKTSSMDVLVDGNLAQRTRELTQQTRQLQSELEAEKLHSRRLEATLQLLRDRSQSQKRAMPPIKTFGNQATTQHLTTSYSKIF